MELSESASRNGIKYRAAWNRYKAGKIPGAHLDEFGHVVIPGRGDRMARFANARGPTVIKVVVEVASG